MKNELTAIEVNVLETVTGGWLPAALGIAGIGIPVAAAAAATVWAAGHEKGVTNRGACPAVPPKK